MELEKAAEHLWEALSRLLAGLAVIVVRAWGDLTLFAPL